MTPVEFIHGMFALASLAFVIYAWVQLLWGLQAAMHQAYFEAGLAAKRAVGWGLLALILLHIYHGPWWYD